MVKLLRKREPRVPLSLNNDLIKTIYRCVDYQADHKYKDLIVMLGQRNRGYEAEDFVQDSVREIVKAFDTKTFFDIKSLKGFVKTSMEFWYLKEKRKYFQTKSRGSSETVSLDDNIDDNREMSEVIASNKSVDLELCDLHNMMLKDLYVYFDWRTYRVGQFDELKKLKGGYLLSVNYFINAQRELGKRDTVAHYKSKGFYMTQSVFDNMSQAIVDYIKTNEILDIQEEFDYKIPEEKLSVEDFIANRTELANVCTCGAKKEDYNYSERFWQCPKCGKIHDRDKLIDYRLGLIDTYEPQETTFQNYKTNSRLLDENYVTCPL